MKRTIAIILAMLTIAALLTGCGSRGNVSTTPDGTVNGSNNANGFNDNQAVPPREDRPTQTEPNRQESGRPVEPYTGNSGVSDYDRPSDGNGNSGLREGINDAGDMVQDAGQAVEDAVTGRNSEVGTGMIGGR